MHALLAFLLAGQGAPSVPYRWKAAPETTAFVATVKGVRHAPSEGVIAAGDFAPETLVCAGPSGLTFSLDEGESWRPAPGAPPDARGGALAVSADGRTWVWSLPAGSYRTEDYGFVWTPCEGVPPGLKVVADRTSPARFYALDLPGNRLFISEDGARHFRERPLGLPNAGARGELLPTPGRSGDLWLTTDQGLYHASVARGWSRKPGITEARALGFGKGDDQTTALYLAGSVEGVAGVFRSYDEGKSWARIDDAETAVTALRVSGDPQRKGRVYLEVQGRGVFVGNPR